MNTLKSFSKVQGSALGPYFFEADDYLTSENNLPFYVMEYIEGEGFLRVHSKKRNELDWRVNSSVINKFS